MLTTHISMLALPLDCPCTDPWTDPSCWPFPWTVRVLIRGLIRVLNSYQPADHTYQHAGPSREFTGPWTGISLLKLLSPVDHNISIARALPVDCPVLIRVNDPRADTHISMLARPVDDPLYRIGTTDCTMSRQHIRTRPSRGFIRRTNYYPPADPTLSQHLLGHSVDSECDDWMSKSVLLGPSSTSAGSTSYQNKFNFLRSEGKRTDG
ncbi:hypothetical protein IGI04_043124 [Brassica rapa subsp. trilocularis]|uniref:Uncharacterized protein n=1 Tax=Brassica rapa subsp. trilocularis TaxID=1813537 RepID=A0ABQ7KKS5_BRACM|nr:hypothetical protein IGI04_043124 [Brassica rapa subsp. trilocularis]